MIKETLRILLAKHFPLTYNKFFSRQKLFRDSIILNDEFRVYGVISDEEACDNDYVISFLIEAYFSLDEAEIYRGNIGEDYDPNNSNMPRVRRLYWWKKVNPDKRMKGDDLEKILSDYV